MAEPLAAPTAPGFTNPVAPVTALPNNGGQAVLVTSTPARSVTADNTQKLAQITAPTASPATQTTETASTGNGMYQYKTSDGRTISIGDPSINRDQLAGATFLSGPTGKETDPLAGGTAPSGAESPYDGITSSIKDPGVASQFKTALQNIDSEVASAKSNIEDIQKRSLNDPAAQAMVASIKQKYDAQISLLKDRNKILLGKFSTGNAAFGGLGQMGQSFLNDEQSKADARVADLQSKEDDAIMKAQIAYQTNNYKDLNKAMDAYDKANKTKLEELNKLLDATNKSVKQMQDEQKLSLAAEKQAVQLDVTKSTNLGMSIAKNIADSGITDEKQIEEYVNGVAQEYGITNVDILKSAIEKARTGMIKTAAGTANTLNTMSNREKSTQIKQQNANKQKPTPKVSFNPTEGISKVTPQMKKIAGTDGYIDPAKWVAARQNWMSLGGTKASFDSNFKQYLNPLSYTKAGFKSASGTTDIP